MEKIKLILLHGAIGSQDQFKNLLPHLKDKMEVYTFNFSEHGGEPLSDTPFSIERLAHDVMKQMDQQGIARAHFFGYSMGGYIGLYIARWYPQYIDKLFTFATKFYWDEAIAQKEVTMLNPVVIQEKIPVFADMLAQRHAPEDWKLVLLKTAELLYGLGKTNPLTEADLQAITLPVLVGVGDKDSMVGVEETTSLYSNLSHGELYIMPDTPHPIEKINAEKLAQEMCRFFL